MTETHDTYYQALASRDHRFDGRFFVGVSSTGIYCRPICPAPLAKSENCTFFETAAAAQDEGYRPCKRCRPELAPGLSCIDMPGSLIDQAMLRINQGFLNTHSAADLAQKLGISERHLRRLFQQWVGVSPNKVAANQRLLRARHLLLDTQLAITDIAFISGFQSVRSFNHAFQTAMGEPPQQIRRHAPVAEKPLEAKLGVRPPYDWALHLNFLRQRRIPGVELIHDDVYRRTVAICTEKGEQIQGWIEIRYLPKTCQLSLRIDHRLAAHLLHIIEKVRQLFDLDCDPLAIQATLGSLGEKHPGLRLPGAFDPFEMSVRAILGQQVTVKAAHTLAARLAAAYGKPVETPWPELTHTFPSPETVANLDRDAIASCGIIAQRADAILALARAIESETLDLSDAADIDTTIERLQTIKGIGPWTASYIAMRALHWPDAFLADDLGVKKALNLTDRKSILAQAEAWHPWRAYAVMHLWHKEK